MMSKSIVDRGFRWVKIIRVFSKCSDGHETWEDVMFMFNEKGEIEIWQKKE